MSENKLADISTEFAVSILKLTDGIKGHYSLSNQLERSETRLAQTSVKQNMRTAALISSQNCRLL